MPAHGYITRRFNQRSKSGAFADTIPLLTVIVFPTFLPWGETRHIPIWFTALMITRDLIIIVGIRILHYFNQYVSVRPHRTGKIHTVTQIILSGWIILKIIPCPTIPATILTVLSAVEYFREELRRLNHHH